MLHYESTNNALNRHVYFLNFRAILPRISIGLHSKNQLPNREATTMYFLHELNFTGTYGALPLIALSSPSSPPKTKWFLTFLAESCLVPRAHHTYNAYSKSRDNDPFT